MLLPTKKQKKPLTKYQSINHSSIRKVIEPVNPDTLILIKLKEIIEANYENDSFDSIQLAKYIGMSRVQLFRKLKALTGVSASHFIRFYRLSKAKEIIIKTNLHISEIAYGVGFNDPAYFTRAFSKEFGVTPTSLRE